MWFVYVCAAYICNSLGDFIALIVNAFPFTHLNEMRKRQTYLLSSGPRNEPISTDTSFDAYGIRWNQKRYVCINSPKIIFESYG